MKSIMEGDQKGECYICGFHGYTEVHHIFGGANRKISDREGLTVNLCRECHTGKYGAHNDKEIMDFLRRSGQRTFEKTHSREEFMQLFGRNYL